MRLPALLLAATLTAACGGNEGPPPPPVVVAPTPPPKKAQDTAAPDQPNRPPRVKSITFLPKEPTTSESVRVDVKVEDPDGDPVNVDYLWFVNGERQLTRTRDNLPFLDFKKGDQLSVQLSLDDGTQIVQQMSETITVANSPPKFTTDPRGVSKIDGMVLQAEDPDDDTVTFSLQGAPDGMSIGKTSGKLSYTGTESEKGGTYKITVLAQDGDSGRAQWSFQINVAPGSAAAKAAKDAEDAKAKGG